jgi:hypothetical protein
MLQLIWQSHFARICERLINKTISFHFLDTDLRIDSANHGWQAPSGVVDAARKSPMTTIL